MLPLYRFVMQHPINKIGARSGFFDKNGGFQTSQKDTFITFGKEMEPFIISKSGNTQWFVDFV